MSAIWHWIVDHFTNGGHYVGILMAMLLHAARDSVQTGHKGVLFRFGKVHGTVGPGTPALQIKPFFVMRQVRVLTTTLDLASQRICSGDGFEWDVDSTISYKVSDPVLATTAVDDYDAGVRSVSGLVVTALVAMSSTKFLRDDRKAIEEAAETILRRVLPPWGIEVERFGFTAIAPAASSLRVMQVRSLAMERLAALEAISDPRDPIAARRALATILKTAG